ncbi:MAG: D-tyrosyl-tRNA(Tyr) deacylase [Hymenobacteraceae bacterium]|nr:D-tyrosyl-tRNA(Tyr) deacylase [Hymenobacteraceae bacterium]
MRFVVQRVREASVTIGGAVRGQIGPGLLVLVGIAPTDTAADAQRLARKLVNLRILADEEGKMNRSVLDTGGDILLISQFPLLADARKGNRPSYIGAAPLEVAFPLYQTLIREVEAALGKPIQTGEFGADMQVSLVNDGPVTIILDS